MLASSRGSALSALQCIGVEGLSLWLRLDGRGLELVALGDGEVDAVVVSLVYGRHVPPVYPLILLIADCIVVSAFCVDPGTHKQYSL